MRINLLVCKAFIDALSETLPAAQTLLWAAPRDATDLSRIVASHGLSATAGRPSGAMAEGARFDAVLCCDRLNGETSFWDSFLQLAGCVREGGQLLLVEPITGPYRADHDCWRFHADAGVALESWAHNQGRALSLQESFVLPGLDRDSAAWFVASFRCSDQAASARLHQTFRRAGNVRIGSAGPALAICRDIAAGSYFAQPARHSAPVYEQARPSAAPVCNVCGGRVFGPGPNGRMAKSGLPPCCQSCGSLERQRILRRVMQCFPIGFLDGRRALQFSPDNGIPQHLFAHYEVSVFGGENSLDMQSIQRPAASYDLVAFSHVLEFIPDARAAFGEVARILDRKGILVAGFSDADQRALTEDYAQPTGPHGAWHLFGGDLAEYFDCHRLGLVPCVVTADDPCTGVREAIHLFARNVADALDMCEWLQAWIADADVRL